MARGVRKVSMDTVARLKQKLGRTKDAAAKAKAKYDKRIAKVEKELAAALKEREIEHLAMEREDARGIMMRYRARQLDERSDDPMELGSDSE